MRRLSRYTSLAAGEYLIRKCVLRGLSPTRNVALVMTRLPLRFGLTLGSLSLWRRLTTLLFLVLKSLSQSSGLILSLVGVWAPGSRGYTKSWNCLAGMFSRMTAKLTRRHIRVSTGGSKIEDL